MKWKGYRKKTLDDEIESGEAFYIDDEDLVTPVVDSGKPPL